jgi:signal transduction histidine kinase
VTGETLLLRAELRHEADVVLVRQYARRLAMLLGFDTQDQTRLATSVSEIARNAYEYATGGRVAFSVTTEQPAAFLVRVADDGPGIRDLAAVLDGRYVSSTGMGLGIQGARRLMDQFAISQGENGGTTVTMGKPLPAAVETLTPARVQAVLNDLRSAASDDPVAELQARNHELLLALDELRERQTEVERLNRELAETNRGVLALYAELDDRAMQLSRASELKSKFLSNISHELRTPLNAIRNLTRLLLDRLDGGLTSEQERQVGMIQSAATDLSELVSDLLDLARIEAGVNRVRPSEFRVADLLATLRGMLRPLLLTDLVLLIVEPVDAALMLQTDEGKVSQILRNLVANAIKFTERGEIRVSTSMGTGEEMVQFVVRDTGVGIAPDNIEHIFEEYVQVEGPLQRHAGAGLGLPLSRKLAELLGGSLTVTSIVGIGSEFILRIPRIYQPEASRSPASAHLALPAVRVQHA